MTVKTVTTIELKDIALVEFECKGCQTRVSYPLDKFTHPVTACKVCKDQRQFIVHGSSEYAEWTKFAELLKRFAQENSNFTFRLELASASREGA